MNTLNVILAIIGCVTGFVSLVSLFFYGGRLVERLEQVDASQHEMVETQREMQGKLEDQGKILAATVALVDAMQERELRRDG